MYTEDDLTDAEDLYGRTKALGEVDRPGCLTIRTSIIGRDFLKQSALLEWFLAQRGGTVGATATPSSAASRPGAGAHHGRRDRATTRHCTGSVRSPSEPITKLDLLNRIRDAMRPRRDHRALRRSSLRPQPRRRRVSWRLTGYRIPTWDEMVAELAADPTPYDDWRRRHAAA